MAISQVANAERYTSRQAGANATLTIQGLRLAVLSAAALDLDQGQ